MKICARCGIKKSLDCFYKNRRSADGHTYSCKECKKFVRNKDVSKRDYQKRKASLSSYHKERYAAGCDSAREASRLSAKASSQGLSDAYIRKLITQRSAILPKDIPLSLVAAKRLQVQILRLSKELTDEEC